MSRIMDAMGYKNEFEPTGITVKCAGYGRHNGEAGVIFNKPDTNTLYVKFDGNGVFVKVNTLEEMGYTFTAYQPWAQAFFDN